MKALTDTKNHIYIYSNQHEDNGISNQLSSVENKGRHMEEGRGTVERSSSILVRFRVVKVFLFLSFTFDPHNSSASVIMVWRMCIVGCTVHFIACMTQQNASLCYDALTKPTHLLIQKQQRPAHRMQDLVWTAGTVSRHRLNRPLCVN